MQQNIRRLNAFILHRTSVKEKDRIVEAFTREEGRVRFFAPGVRHVASRRAGHLEPFMETRLVVARSAKGDTIREARVIRTFAHLREDLDRMSAVYAIAELLRRYTGEDIHDRQLYDAIIRIIDAVDTASVLPPLALESAQLHVLRSLGALPDLYRCTHCRKLLKERDFALRSGHRGLWCSTCGEMPDPLLTDVVKVARLHLKEPVLSSSIRVSDDIQKRLRAMLRTLFRTQTFAVRV